MMPAAKSTFRDSLAFMALFLRKPDLTGYSTDVQPGQPAGRQGVARPVLKENCFSSPTTLP